MMFLNNTQLEGYQAFFKGVTSDRSPHEIDDPKSKDWDDGWNYAMNYFKYVMQPANNLPV